MFFSPTLVETLVSVLISLLESEMMMIRGLPWDDSALTGSFLRLQDRGMTCFQL